MLEGRDELRVAHTDVMLRTLVSLAKLRHAAGSPREAAALYRRALEGQVEALGREHPSTVRTLDTLCCLLNELGEPDEVAQLEVMINSLTC